MKLKRSLTVALRRNLSQPRAGSNNACGRFIKEQS